MKTSRRMLYLHRSGQIWHLPWKLHPIDLSTTISYCWIFKEWHLKRNMLTLLTLLELDNIDLLFLSESCLNRLFDDDFCSSFGTFYVVTRADRIHGTHVGVIILCRRNSALNISEIIIDNNYDFAAAATLQNSHNSVALFTLFYLPPASSSYRISFDSFSSFEDVVRKAKSFYPPDKFNMSLIVLGDFNFPDSDWSSMYSSNKRELEFLEYLNFLDLLPLITTGQTHRCGNILDNILTNDNFITGYSIEDNSLSHHSSIIFKYSSEFNKPYQHPTEYSFNDHTDMLNFHNSWEYFSFTSYPSEANVNEFYSFVSWSLNTCFPFRRKVWINNPFYYSSHTIHCLNKLNTAKRKYSMNPIKNDLDSLQSLQREYSDSVELDKIIYINGSSTSSLNQCFSLLNSLKNTSLPNQMFLSQEKLPSTDIPTAFNKYFAGNFNFNSYDGSISTYGALKLDSVLDCLQSFYHIWNYEN